MELSVTQAAVLLVPHLVFTTQNCNYFQIDTYVELGF